MAVGHRRKPCCMCKFTGGFPRQVRYCIRIRSRLHSDHLTLQDYELLKAFPDINTHDCKVNVPIFNNDQDIARLAAKVDAVMDTQQDIYGYLISGHGFYTWGDTVDDAMRHVEAFEFLFQCEITLRGGKIL